MLAANPLDVVREGSFYPRLIPSGLNAKLGPPKSTLDVLCDLIDSRARLTAVKALHGGIENGVHLVEVTHADGRVTRVVLRRFAGELREVDAGVLTRHARLLGLLRENGMKVPIPLWVDTEGALFGAPALVTSHVEGRPDLAPVAPAPWARGLARALAQIHRVDTGANDLSFLALERPRTSLGIARMDSVEAARDLAVAVERYEPRLRHEAPVLLHYDFQPSNVLWTEGRVAGVVDWDRSRRGLRGFDVAHCRLDIALLQGVEVADVFLEEYERAIGARVEMMPLWDLGRALAALPWVDKWLPGLWGLGRPDVTADVARARLREVARRAVERLSDA